MEKERQEVERFNAVWPQASTKECENLFCELLTQEWVGARRKANQ